MVDDVVVKITWANRQLWSPRLGSSRDKSLSLLSFQPFNWVHCWCWLGVTSLISFQCRFSLVLFCNWKKCPSTKGIQEGNRSLKGPGMGFWWWLFGSVCGVVLFGLFVVVRFVVWGLVALVYVCLYFPLPGSCTNISRRQEKGTGHILNPGGSFVPEKGEVVSNALGTARCRVCTQMNREQAERLKLPVSCSCHADLCIHYLSCSFSDTEWNKITVPVCRAHVLQFATNHFGNVCVKQSL